MKTIILCNQLSRLRRILKTTQQPFDFICLQDPRGENEVCAYLRQLVHVNELPRASLVREISENFRANYIDFMGQVNIANHSHGWWAMPFTDKYSLSSRLCRNLFDFRLIIEALRSDARYLVVLTDNRDLAGQVIRWSKTADVAVNNAIRNRFTLKEFIRRTTPAGMIKAILRSSLLWLLGRRLRPTRDRTSEHLLIATHTHSRSFSNGQAYKDAYFGSLMDDLAAGQKAMVLGLPYERPFHQLDEIKRLDSGIPVVPMDSCFTLLSLLACTSQALKAYLLPHQPNGPTILDGLEVNYLVKQAIRETARSGDYFVNLKVYYCAKWMAQQVNVSRCLYPYENRAWEKMLILGIGETSPQTRMVGYQYTSITPHHTNFVLVEDEAAITPLPSAILTCGDVTRDWLAKEGSYPAGMLISACVSRQSPADEPTAYKTSIDETRSITKLLVVLGTGEEEYASAPRFLEEALGNTDRFQVRLRPHPNLPELELPSLPFYSISTGPLADDLQWADAILYASSTVSMEAITLGIPAIFLDFGSFLNTDPMFGWDEFKWPVNEPSELIEAIQDIESLPKEKFQDLQQKGRDYVFSYLKPPTPSNKQLFWKA